MKKDDTMNGKQTQSHCNRKHESSKIKTNELWKQCMMLSFEF